MKDQKFYTLIENAINSIRNEMITEALNQSPEYHEIALQLEKIQEQLYSLGLTQSQLSIIKKYITLMGELSEKESRINYIQGIKAGIYLSRLWYRELE